MPRSRRQTALLATDAAVVSALFLQQAAALGLYRDCFQRLLQGKPGRPITEGDSRGRSR